jgi:hypothetical protein
MSFYECLPDFQFFEDKKTTHLCTPRAWLLIAAQVLSDGAQISGVSSLSTTRS